MMCLNDCEKFSFLFLLLSGVEDNFQRHKSYDARIQDTTYDYESIMHYSRTAFNTNGKNTIEAIHDPNVKLGGKQLSALDIIEINKMYQCNGNRSFQSIFLQYSI